MFSARLRNPHSISATLRTFLPYLWPRGDWLSHLRLILALLFLIAAKVATVWVPIVYAHAVDVLVPRTGTPLLAIPVALIVSYGLLRVAAAGFGEMRDAVFAAVQQRAVRVAALSTFRHLHTLSLRYHLERHTGSLARAISRGASGIESVLRLAVFNLVPTVIETMLVTAIVWYLFDWSFALATFIAVLLYLVFTLTFTNWRVRFRRTMNEVDSEAQGQTVDSLLNYETVKYFNNEAYEARRYDETRARYERAAVRSQVTLNFLNLGQAAIIALGLTVVMLMAARGVLAHKMTVGQFVLVNTYLMQLYQPLNFLGFAYREVRQGLADMEQMFALFNVPPEMADRADAALLPAGRIPGAVAFEGVRFGYNQDREIIKDVTFTVAPGQKLAIVGPTGAGKTTIARLLYRFYEVSGGRITVDGSDIRDLAQESLRRAIGVVPQDTVLFNDTIRYNIAYGRPTASEAEVEHATRLAQIHDFVMSLPGKYETVVGERGLKLSGGEKQRIAIARTILKDPSILILDEATSALDSRTEQEIATALRAVARDRTTVVIAHRLSTVVDADEILVLMDGRVAERGSHAELLARDGIYAQMWAMQSLEEQRSSIAA